MTQNMINEIWIDCTIDPMYEVSNSGKIRYKLKEYNRTHLGKCISVPKSNKVIGKNLSTKGYFRANIKGKTYFVHRLIAYAFIPNPNNLQQINHIDGNKLNNNINNLEWVTNQQNRDHAVKNGLHASGERANSKLSSQDILNIKNMAIYTNTKEIAELYNITRKYVNTILRNQVWRHLNEKIRS